MISHRHQSVLLSMKTLAACANFSYGRVTGNTGILPVSSNGHPAWSRMSRLGSLHDLSGWKPKLLRLRRSRAGFHRVLMHVVQPRKPRFLERQASVPEFVHDPAARSVVDAVEPHCQCAVQMPHQITLRFRGVFEADDKMIVIGRRRPNPVELAHSFSPTRKLCRAKDPALRRNRKVALDAALPP